MMAPDASFVTHVRCSTPLTISERTSGRERFLHLAPVAGTDGDMGRARPHRRFNPRSIRDSYRADGRPQSREPSEISFRPRSRFS